MREKQRVPVARLKATFKQTNIENDARIIRGVRVMELGKLAQFKTEDGKSKKITITDAHISALLSHAGNRAIPMHWTHDWSESDRDPLHDRMAALKELRKDENGNLIGDAHLAPGEYGDKVLWSAANEPENVMLSAVYSYAKKDALCLPLDFSACDFVSQGAATTALLEETKTSSMDISEFITMLSDPGVKDALKAVIKSVEKGQDDATSDADAAAMESDAGVTQADMAADDDKKPALMRAHLRIARVNKRLLAELKAEKVAILAEAKVQSEAAATALLGKGGLLKLKTDDPENLTATAKFNLEIKALTDKGVVYGAANIAVIKNHPELLEAMNKEKGIFKSK